MRGFSVEQKTKPGQLNTEVAVQSGVGWFLLGVLLGGWAVYHPKHVQVFVQPWIQPFVKKRLSSRVIRCETPEQFEKGEMSRSIEMGDFGDAGIIEPPTKFGMDNQVHDTGIALAGEGRAMQCVCAKEQRELPHRHSV